MKTYRAAIQIQIEALQKIYDNAEGLRDCCDTDEQKEAFNSLRRSLPILWRILQNVDNNMEEKTAQYETRGNYSIAVNYDSI